MLWYKSNAPSAIFKWALNATRYLTKENQKRLMVIANTMIQDGKWRGNISEAWVKQFPELKSQLQDLYL